jgi:hypothetical protein
MTPFLFFVSLLSASSENFERVVATESGWVEAGVNFGSANVQHVRRPRVRHRLGSTDCHRLARPASFSSGSTDIP